MTTLHHDPRQQVNEFCAKLGSDPLLVQGAGGNVSWKSGTTLWIKASGTWLKEAIDKDIFVPVDLTHLSTAIANDDMGITPKLIGDSRLRPSIETLLHALMPQRFVVHLHAIDILAHIVKTGAEAELSKRLNGKISYVLTAYQKPGAQLANAVKVALEQAPNTNVVFLQSHGLVIGGESLDEIENTLQTLLFELRSAPLPLVQATCSAAKTVRYNEQDYRLIEDEGIQQLAINNKLFEKLQGNWALYPDHVVFLGATPRCFDSLEDWQQTPRDAQSYADLVFIRDRGVYANTEFSTAKLVQLRCYYDVISRTGDDTLSSLENEQIAQLLNWDAEQYRQHLAK